MRYLVRCSSFSFQFWHFSRFCQIKNAKQDQFRNIKKKFDVIDSTLTQFGLFEDQKLALYKVIASILHLGNVDFHDQSEGCQIIETEKKSLQNAANLLGMEAEVLAESIMTRVINEKGGASNLKIT